MNNNKRIDIHTHPHMERDLGVPEDHVIIDRDVYFEILKMIQSSVVPHHPIIEKQMDTVTANGRIYPIKVLKKAWEEYEKQENDKNE